MKTRRTIVLTALMALVVGACGAAASPSPSAPASAAPTATRRGIRVRVGRGVGRPRRPRPTALPVRPGGSGHPGRRAGRRPSSFWTFYLSPTFDQYIKDTIARFEATYPGVKVNWDDHQGTFKDDLNNSFAAGNAPDVINLSVSEGWVSEYAGKGLLLGLDTPVPQAVKDIYFPGLWKQQLIDGVNYQFPWYQGLNVELLNKAIFEKAGVDRRRVPEDHRRAPRAVQDLPRQGRRAVRHPPDRQRPARPDGLRGQRQGLRRRRQDLHLQLARGRGVAPDVRRHEQGRDRSTPTVLTGDDRIGLNAFSAGAAPFYATGPNLARQVKDTNATLYEQPRHGPLAARQVRRRGQGPDVDLGQEGHEVPERVHRARAVLHEPAEHGRVRQEGRDLPVVAVGVRRSVLLDAADRRSRTAPAPLAKETVATYQDIVPTVPNKADVNDIVRKAIESALFNKVAPQAALDQAVADANKLINK